MFAYIKLNEYIVKISVYNSEFQNMRSFIPYIYKIIGIKHMVTQEKYDSIVLDNTEHQCVDIQDNVHTFFKHLKVLSINMILIYEYICENTNFIDFNLDSLIDLNEAKFIIMNKLFRAYSDEKEAFYKNFFEDKQWELFENGYSGYCILYNYQYNKLGIKSEEFYHCNDKIEGKKLLYNHQHGRLSRIENYVSGKKIYEEIFNEFGEEIIEKKYYYTDDFYFYEKYKNNDIKQTGYAYLDIPITFLANVYFKIKNFIYSN